MRLVHVGCGQFVLEGRKGRRTLRRVLFAWLVARGVHGLHVQVERAVVFDDGAAGGDEHVASVGGALDDASSDGPFADVPFGKV
jgi:hypothetical protein